MVLAAAQVVLAAAQEALAAVLVVLVEAAPNPHMGLQSCNMGSVGLRIGESACIIRHHQGRAAFPAVCVAYQTKWSLMLQPFPQHGPWPALHPRF